MDQLLYQYGEINMQATPRQRILTILTVTALVLLVWQTAKLIQNNAGLYLITTAHAAPSTHITKSTQGFQAPNETNQSLKKDTLSVEKEDKEANNYLNLINRYKFAKLRLKVLREELEIAQTHSKLIALTQQNTLTNDLNTHHFMTAPKKNASSLPKLIYIDHQKSLWSATLNTGQHLQQIKIGSVLNDGSQITNISKKGVILLSPAKMYYKLSFNDMTPLPNYLQNKPSNANLLKKNNSHKTRLSNVNQASR